jgi:hypothetical protein
MRYMFLLYSDPAAGPAPGSPEQAAEHQQWGEFTQSLIDAGVMLAGDALHGTETATTVRSRGGSTLSTDGPFAETKEVLGGYYVIDVDDLDTATKWAEQVPLVGYGSVEIRPVLDMDDMPSPGA